MQIPLRPYCLFVLSLFIFACNSEETLFEQLPPSQTGLDFSNRITENDTFNIISYEYVYNGGGVGIGDFNADGLQDLFFTGNMVENKLYLNQGDFKFLDITEQAGVASRDQWNSGVAVVDVNNDGWLDLYVCATTYEPGSRRENRLFINNGKTESADNFSVTFTEKAAEYGIADNSHTTNAAFFDYDNDGDLDLYLLVNQMDERAVPSHFRKIATDGTSQRTDKLFRNDFDEKLGHPVFTDISKEAGISIEGYGLGLNICDINRDGWKDIYVSNDYLTNDLLWINTGPKKDSAAYFTNKAASYLKHTSYSAMGNNVADLNNDGFAEILAVDMLPEDNHRRKTMLGPNNYMFYVNNERYGYQYQYVRNTLQLNQGIHPQTQEPLFSEISMHAGISSTDWSWTPLIADFDHDGMRDIIITNGFPKDVTDRDFMEFSGKNQALVERERLESMIPSVKIGNYAFQNTLQEAGGIPEFKNVAQAWGLNQSSFSNGAAYADLDNDGDLDLVTNNINDPAFLYRNKRNDKASENSHNWVKLQFNGSKQNLNGLGLIVEIYYQKGQKQVWENTPYRGYLSSVEQGAHFGLGSTTLLDSIVVIWQEGFKQVLSNIEANQNLQIDIKDANRIEPSPKRPAIQKPFFSDITDSTGIDYIHKELDYVDFNLQNLLLHKFSQYGPGMAVGDINGDGLDDLYIGGSRSYKGEFFVQQADGQFLTHDVLLGSDASEDRGEEQAPLFFDADNDGDQDLYVVRGGYEFTSEDTIYQDRLYLNEKGGFRIAEHALPKFLSSGSCVRAADFDQDGDLDLFVGGRILPAQYPKPISSYLLVNDGKGKFSIGNQKYAQALDNIGLISDAIWTDFDQDGWVDLMLAGEWMPLRFLRNDTGKLIPFNTPELDATSGFWNSLSAADFDLDGDMDYVAGNTGTNTLLKASPERPVAIYMADFDGNDARASTLSGMNGLDAIPSAYFPDKNGAIKEFPFFGKSDMEKQLIAIKKLYLRHHDFALASMPEILRQFPAAKPSVYQAKEFRSLYIENLGAGKFVYRALPTAAQLAPVFGLITEDVNGDNLPDIVLIGNDYGTEIGMGRSDALNGLVLLNDGKAQFTPISLEESGICIPGDGKSLVKLMSAKGYPLVAAGQNRGPLKVFKKAISNKNSISLQTLDYAAIIHLDTGKSLRTEMPYGGGFLSQSARRLFLGKEVAYVEVINYQGERRKIQVK